MWFFICAWMKGLFIVVLLSLVMKCLPWGWPMVFWVSGTGDTQKTKRQRVEDDGARHTGSLSRGRTLCPDRWLFHLIWTFFSEWMNRFILINVLFSSISQELVFVYSEWINQWILINYISYLLTFQKKLCPNTWILFLFYIFSEWLNKYILIKFLIC